MVLDGLDCMNTTSHNYLTCIPYKQKHCGIAWGQPDVDANPFTYVLPAVGKEKQCNATGWQSWEMQCQYLARTGVDAVELAQCTQYNALKATKL